MIVGLTGSIAAGKGVVAEFLKQKGLIYHSLSMEVREEANKRAIEITRSNLQDLGNELRSKEGAGAWARRFLDKIIEGNYIIDGIRNPAEVAEFEKTENFHLISIDAPLYERFKRVVSRNKESDPKTLEGFLEMNKRDLGEDDPKGQQVAKCMERAHYSIMNDSDLESLNKKIEAIYAKIKHN